VLILDFVFIYVSSRNLFLRLFVRLDLATDSMI